MKSFIEWVIAFIIAVIVCLGILWVSTFSIGHNEPAYIHIETMEYPIADTDKTIKVYRYIKEDKEIEFSAYTDDGAIRIEEAMNGR